MSHNGDGPKMVGFFLFRLGLYNRPVNFWSFLPSYSPKCDTLAEPQWSAAGVTSERRKRCRPDCPASLIHFMSVKRDSHKILTPEPGRLVLAKLLTKEEKAADGQRTHSNLLQLRWQLSRHSFCFIRWDPFFLLLTLSVCFYPDSNWYLSMVTGLHAAPCVSR